MNSFAGKFLIGYGFCVALDLMWPRDKDNAIESALTNPFNIGAGLVWAFWKAS